VSSPNQFIKFLGGAKRGGGEKKFLKFLTGLGGGTKMKIKNVSKGNQIQSLLGQTLQAVHNLIVLLKQRLFQ